MQMGEHNLQQLLWWFLGGVTVWLVEFGRLEKIGLLVGLVELVWFVGFVWSVWSVWLVWLVWLVRLAWLVRLEGVRRCGETLVMLLSFPPFHIRRVDLHDMFVSLLLVVFVYFRKINKVVKEKQYGV